MSQIILGVDITGNGHHVAAPISFPKLEHYRHVLQTAEAAKLDFVFLDDRRAQPSQSQAGYAPVYRLDALSVLARLAPETKHIGLALSKPTTYSEPFTVSRELATLDFISHGRAAWNASSLGETSEAQNFGETQAKDPMVLRSIGEEFIEVSKKLWDSWEDDAVVADRHNGIYLDPSKLHHINHVGQHFQIRGPQITYRPPQGHVVVIQVADEAGVTPLAVQFADVVVLRVGNLADAQTSYRNLKNQAKLFGRNPDHLKILVAAATSLSNDPPVAYPANTLWLEGKTTSVVDHLEAWFIAKAADGFLLLPDVLPDGLERIAEQLIPEFQRRGLFRSEYHSTTLRQHLGIPQPKNQFLEAAD